MVETVVPLAYRLFIQPYRAKYISKGIGVIVRFVIGHDGYGVKEFAGAQLGCIDIYDLGAVRDGRAA